MMENAELEAFQTAVHSASPAIANVVALMAGKTLVRMWASSKTDRKTFELNREMFDFIDERLADVDKEFSAEEREAISQFGDNLDKEITEENFGGDGDELEALALIAEILKTFFIDESRKASVQAMGFLIRYRIACVGVELSKMKNPSSQMHTGETKKALETEARDFFKAQKLNDEINALTAHIRAGNLNAILNTELTV